MKVICINSKACPPGAFITDKSIIKEGEIYSVISEQIAYGYRWYELQEHKDWFYMAESFIPLSEIDEMELVNEKELAV